MTPESAPHDAFEQASNVFNETLKDAFEEASGAFNESFTGGAGEGPEKESVFLGNFSQSELVIFGITITLVVVTILQFIVFRKRSKARITVEDLGVGDCYNWCGFPEEEMNEYFELRDQLKDLFAPEADEDDLSWLANLPENPKNLLKFRLMKWTVGLIEGLDSVQQDRRGYARMYSNKVITERCYRNFQWVEQTINPELEEVQAQAALIEPGTNTNTLIQDAVRIFHQKGRDWANSDKDSSKADSSKAESSSAASMPRGSMSSVANSEGSLRQSDRSSERPSDVESVQRSSVKSKESSDLSLSDLIARIMELQARSPRVGFREDPTEVDVIVELPDGVDRSDITVKIEAERLFVQVKETTVIDGELTHPIDVDGSTFTVDPNALRISLEKRNSTRWGNLLKEQEEAEEDD